jgi:hypothetical protein
MLGISASETHTLIPFASSSRLIAQFRRSALAGQPSFRTPDISSFMYCSLFSPLLSTRSLFALYYKLYSSVTRCGNL